MLLTVALTLEVLFLDLTVTADLAQTVRSRARIVAISVALALLLPLGTIAATPVAMLPAGGVTACLAFGLIALLYLVTEALLFAAHEQPDSPLITAMFFVGFLGLLLIEEAL